MNHENTKERKHEKSKYFFCEKAEVQLPKVMCVFWQKRAQEEEHPPRRLLKCLDCELGRRVAAELISDRVLL